MNNEDNDSRFLFRFFIGMNILFVIGFILVVFLLCCDSANALQVVHYNSTKNINGTTYYGYNLPTRPTNFDGSSSASVNVNLSYYYNNNWVSYSTSTELLYLSSLDNRITDEIEVVNNSLGRDFNPTNVWTKPLQLGSQVNIPHIVNNFNYTFGFRPSAFIDDDIDKMFEDGYLIYEDDSILNMNKTYSYTYDFDMILYNFDNSQVNNSLPSNQQLCIISIGDSFTCNNVQNNITFDTIVNTDNIIYRTYHINFNSNTWYFGFNTYTIDKENSLYGIYGNNLINSNQNYNIYSNDYLMISQPYNIVFWSTDNSYTCSSSCWTQEDSNNNQRIPSYNDYLIDNIASVVDGFDYYGFSGVINYTYDFIKSLLDDTNDSCISLSIPVLGKYITLPSSCSFWSREDVSQYESFYHMFILGIFSFFIAWKIYNDILNIYIPDKRIDEEVSKL